MARRRTRRVGRETCRRSTRRVSGEGAPDNGLITTSGATVASPFPQYRAGSSRPPGRLSRHLVAWLVLACVPQGRPGGASAPRAARGRHRAEAPATRAAAADAAAAGRAAGRSAVRGRRRGRTRHGAVLVVAAPQLPWRPGPRGPCTMIASRCRPRVAWSAELRSLARGAAVVAEPQRRPRRRDPPPPFPAARGVALSCTVSCVYGTTVSDARGPRRGLSGREVAGACRTDGRPMVRALASSRCTSSGCAVMGYTGEGYETG